MKSVTVIEAFDLTAQVLEGAVSAREKEIELSVTFGLVELWRKCGANLHPVVASAFESGAKWTYLSKNAQEIGLRVATTLQLLCLRVSDQEELKKEQALAAVYLRHASSFLRTHGYSN